MKTIELTAPHQHGGRDYPPGTKLEVDDADADWLIALEKAKPTGKPLYPRAVESAAQPETTTKEKAE